MKRLSVALTAILMASGSPGLADEGENKPADRGPQELFSKLDQDANGTLAKDEVPEAQVRFFERLVRVGDKNDDGQLTKEEFAAAMSQAEPQSDARPEPGRPGFGPGGGRPQFDGAMFERLDANKDGKLTKDELPEQARERMGQMFERLGKDSLTREDFQRMAERGSEGRPGPGRPGEGRPGPEMLARLKEMDANKDGKVTVEEAPEEAKDRVRQLLERIGRDAIDLEQMARMMEQGGPRRLGGPEGERRRPEGEGADRPRPEGERPAGDRPRPEGERPEGDRPRPEAREGGDRPRPEGERPEGDRPRPEGREGDRPRPEGERPGMPRDGEGRPREGAGPGGFQGPAIVRILDANRDGRLSREEFMSLGEKFQELDRNGDGQLDPREIFGGPPPGVGMPRDGEGGPRGFGPPDGEGGPRGPRDGEGRPPEGFRPPRDGERGLPEGQRPPRDGEDRPAREGEDRPRPERPEADA